MGRLLPLDYGVRNLARRPLRTLLCGLSSALVAALFAATAAFVHGLEASHAAAGREDVAILVSRVSERDVLRSTVAAAVPELLAATLTSVARPGGLPAISPEIHVGTNLRVGPRPERAGEGEERVHQAFVRGIDQRAFLVHDAVTILEGRPPGPGEVIVGRLVPERLGLDPAHFAIGRTLRFENGSFVVSGRFAAPGTTIESELWASVQDLKSYTRREDVSAIFLRFEDPAAGFAELDLFTRRRLDLELAAMRSSDYYAELAAWFGPIRALSWLLAALIGAAALAGGANTLNAAVQDRVRELATLRAVGYPARALGVALAQESLVLAAAGGLAGIALARLFVSGSTFGIAMGAFRLEVGPRAVLVALCAALAIGLAASFPAAWRASRLAVSAALREP